MNSKEYEYTLIDDATEIAMSLDIILHRHHDNYVYIIEWHPGLPLSGSGASVIARTKMTTFSNFIQSKFSNQNCYTKKE